VVRQWQAGVSQRGIARATGLARETVNKYLAAAGTLGLNANGPPPSEEQIVALVRLGQWWRHRVRGRRRLEMCWSRTANASACGSSTSSCN
jgi:transposase